MDCLVISPTHSVISRSSARRPPPHVPSTATLVFGTPGLVCPCMSPSLNRAGRRGIAWAFRAVLGLAGARMSLTQHRGRSHLAHLASTRLRDVPFVPLPYYGMHVRRRLL